MFRLLLSAEAPYDSASMVPNISGRPVGLSNAGWNCLLGSTVDPAEQGAKLASTDMIW